MWGHVMRSTCHVAGGSLQLTYTSLVKLWDIATTGSSVELRQQIEGKLSEREDPDVQVVVQETPHVETIL